jgi:F-type H+-transporting ATPase subunit gamma
LAGGGLLELKRRIRSVANTQKITRAMGLVATAKFKKVREKAEKTAPYYTKFHESINSLALSPDVLSSKYFTINNADLDIYVIISSNTGLCGSYNTNVFNEALAQMKGNNVKLITIGEKAKSFFGRRDFDIMYDYTGFGDVITYKSAIEALRPAIEEYEKGKAKNVYLIYTKFYNPVKIKVETIKVLPFEKPEGKQEERLFEPSPKEVFDYVLPKYLSTTMYYALVNSVASEITSRMNAMDNATKNANEILDALKLKYNRARQGNITQEITEIVGGAEVLKD